MLCEGSNWPSAGRVVWLWVGIELVNGIGHPAWSLARRGYTPGVVTSLVLLPLALALARRLRARSGARPVVA
jgi:uncharacterized protein with HXXEE motif